MAEPTKHKYDRGDLAETALYEHALAIGGSRVLHYAVSRDDFDAIWFQLRPRLEGERSQAVRMHIPAGRHELVVRLDESLTGELREFTFHGQQIGDTWTATTMEIE